VQKLGAHVAAIGFTFYTGKMFPGTYQNAAIIAQHGSWNRSTPSGYRVMVARTEGPRVTAYEHLVEGFLPASGAAGGRGATKTAIGRPVDVLQMPDGSIPDQRRSRKPTDSCQLPAVARSHRVSEIAMFNARQVVGCVLLTFATVASLSAFVRTQGRTEITINDTGVQAENLTSSQDGSAYFRSTAKGALRATAGNLRLHS
jgi:hypothetical protein